MNVTVERLNRPAPESDLRQLALLLVDAVNSGAAVSFVAPLSAETAEQWWRSCVADARCSVLVVRDEQGIVGSVQLHRPWAPNQPHRGDVAKLLVHHRGRRRGIATQLMAALEREAIAEGLTLLTLDTRRGDAAEALYRRCGWTEAGVIPRYALSSDGTPHDTVIFYKELDRDAQGGDSNG